MDVLKLLLKLTKVRFVKPLKIFLQSTTQVFGANIGASLTIYKLYNALVESVLSLSPLSIILYHIFLIFQQIQAIKFNCLLIYMRD